jgi:glutathione synthase/RimK-type ligase-like ATP-grasp enzyme
MDRMSSPGTIDDFATVQPVVVLATCLAVLDSAREDAYGQAGLESGDGLLADALTNRDVKTRLAAWDDPTIEWDAIVACVLRSTWDYPERLNEFTRWMDAVSEKTLLLNDADLVRWNIHKRYLIDLERAGIPVVPTVHVERGGVLDLPRLQGGLGSDGLVIKPAVGAGSFGVTRVSPDDPESIAVAGSLVRAGDVIVQPYVPSIETEGETSTILVAGTISHAVVKTPAPGEYRVQPHHGGRSDSREVGTDLRDLWDRLAPVLPGKPMYGRIDTVTIDGKPHVMELELIEPSLFLRHEPKAADLLADAIVQRIEVHLKLG